MPVILEAGELGDWLDAVNEPAEARLALLDPAPVGTIVHHGVAKAVGNVKNDGPELIEAADSSLF
jgi:putative SOS response-associated peptidase YedK